MRSVTTTLAVVFVVGLLWGITLTVVIMPSAPPTYVTVTTPVRTVCFSPNGGCAEQVVYWIGRANLTIHILIYSFTLDSIGDALIVAYERGVTIQIVFESSQLSNYSQYDRLEEAGIQVRKDTNPAAMHDKLWSWTGMWSWLEASTGAKTQKPRTMIFWLPSSARLSRRHSRQSSRKSGPNQPVRHSNEYI